MNLPKVTIIDYGSGNLLSVKRALEYCNADVTITSDYKIISKSDRIVLPGVGAFPNAMSKLKNLDLCSAIQDYSNNSKPFLAICLGMQLLFDESEEISNTQGLSIINGKVVKIAELKSKKNKIKVPHIGWSPIFKSDRINEWSKSVLKHNNEGDFMYFVHSFKVIPKQDHEILAWTKYGDEEIASVINVSNIWACQFHPEKSGTQGLKILKNFVNL